MNLFIIPQKICLERKIRNEKVPLERGESSRWLLPGKAGDNFKTEKAYLTTDLSKVPEGQRAHFCIAHTLYPKATKSAFTKFSSLGEA